MSVQHISIDSIRDYIDQLRFWSKVDFLTHDSCWLWRGVGNDDGYANFTSKGKSLKAHRYAYEITIGPIPAGLTIDHLCRTRNCVNPMHLEPVTIAENVRRAYSVKTRCKNGHLLSGDNLDKSVLRKGRRRCIECSKEWQKKYLSKPEVKQRKSEWSKKRAQSPEIRERQRLACLKYQAKKREQRNASS